MIRLSIEVIKRSQLVLLFTCHLLVVNAQDYACIFMDPPVNWGVKIECDPAPVIPNEHRLVKIYFHIYNDDDGNLGVPLSRQDVVLNLLNEYFIQANISFFYDPCETRSVDSTTLINTVNLDDYFNTDHRHLDGVDIHLAPDYVPGNQNLGSKASAFGGDELVLGGKENTGDPESTTVTVAHEMGHCFGLYHTFQGICVNEGQPTDFANNDYVCDTPPDVRGSVVLPGCAYNSQGRCMEPDTSWNTPLVDNIMSYYLVDCRSKFTPGQIEKMFQDMSTDIIHDFPNTCCEPGADYSIPQIDYSTYTYDSDGTLPGNLIIPATTIVVVQAQMRFGAGQGIYVERGGKLIIQEGGVLTACSEDKWKGIVVEGQLDIEGQPNPNGPFQGSNETFSGAVYLQEGGIIEEAEIGISTINDRVAPSEQQDYYGGLIVCNGGIIRNCTKGVEISPYDSNIWQDFDRSSFHNMEFSNLTYGVDIVGSYGVEFTQCQFEDIEKSAIRARNGAVMVYDGNTFNNVSTAISLAALIQSNHASEIGRMGTAPNLINATYGVYSYTGNSSEQIEITNTIFNCLVGLQAEGLNNISCQFNDFTGTGMGHGVFVIDAFSNPFTINNNNFSNTGIPLTAYYNNDQLIFNDNCMEATADQDVWIYGTDDVPGIVFENQGSAPLSAGNCFSKNLIPEIKTQGTTEIFNYFVQQSEPTSSCYYPESAANFELKLALGQDQIDCGSGFVGDPTQQSCVPPTSIFDLQSSIAALDSEMATLDESQSLLPEKRRCLQVSLKALARAYAVAGEITLSNTYFAARPEFIWRQLPYSNYLMLDELTLARQYLNGLAVTNSLEQDYVNSQLLYLDYLEDPSFLLQATDETALTTRGLRPGHLNAYSRAIYYVITGERLQLPMPATDRVDEQEKDNEDKLSSSILLFPNPVNGNRLHVAGLAEDEPVDMEIRDMSGAILYHQDDLKNGTILLDRLSAGFYFVTLSIGEDKIHQEKLIIL